jgi:hypothetical protein
VDPQVHSCLKSQILDEMHDWLGSVDTIS